MNYATLFHFVDFSMSQRVCCAAIVLSIVGITCTIGGILLFVYSDSLITANVKKVIIKKLLFNKELFI